MCSEVKPAAATVRKIQQTFYYKTASGMNLGKLINLEVSDLHVKGSECHLCARVRSD